MIDTTLGVTVAAALPWGTRLAIAALVYLACVGLLLTGLNLWPRARAKAARRSDAADGIPAAGDPVTSER